MPLVGVPHHGVDAHRPKHPHPAHAQDPLLPGPLDVDTPNEAGRALWRRLGFVEYALRLATPLPALVERLGGAEGVTFGSVHAQTDDLAGVERAVRTFVPRLGRSARSVVVPPQKVAAR